MMDKMILSNQIMVLAALDSALNILYLYLTKDMFYCKNVKG